ncbi:MAG: response regulator [Deltaproteobacteria bacterium]|nr:response regulator [Deltaproteobacteria bacterium]
MEVAILALGRVLPELLSRPLRAAGHEVTIYHDVRSFTGAVRARPPQAAIIPRRVPGADGLVLTLDLKNDARTALMATIVLGIADSDRRAARAARADGFLSLPFSDADVLEVVGSQTRDKKLILLADDSALIHRHTRPILEEAGYEVVSAADGVEALELARERRPDLVITDVEMPRLDGYGVCRELKTGEGTQHVPVVICSALGEAQDLERGFDAGADDYLVKPVVAEELLSRLRPLIRGAAPGGRERLLVVDDSPAIRHLVADSLARQGFSILTAENGAIGLELAREHTPEMVITDYDMPVMTGFELVHGLKRDPSTRDIPVMMLTARDTRRDQAQMRAVGLTSYLVKPFSVDKCVAMVERILAERRLTRYKEASRVYISEGAARAAEQRAAGDPLGEVRAIERDMAVMFSDIVGFTMMSATMPPREVIDLLNDYFDRLCPIVKAHGGDIDKFIGDAIMGVFDHIPGSDPPWLRATRAAMAMQAALADWNQGRARALSMRIGINSGPVVRGDLGSRFVRRDYTVIGDTVNRANRYEQSCPHGAVLISESTYRLCEPLDPGLRVEPLAGVKLKGIEHPVTAYVVKAISPSEESP